MKVKNSSTRTSWYLTRFYGNLEIDKRKESWSLLSQINIRDGEPWFIIGYFNEILF